MREVLLLAGLLGLFMGWNMPNHYPLWTTFHGELAAALGVCFLFWRAIASPMPRGPGTGLMSPPKSLPIPLAAKVWLAVALIPLAQFAVGQLVFRGDAILGFTYAAGTALSICTGYLWAVRDGRFKVLQTLFTVIVLSSVAAAGLAMVQWLRLPNPGWWAMDLIASRPYGNFAQPNLFGLLMVIGIVAASALFETRALSHRASYGLTVGLLGLGMLVSESRASLLALLLVVAFWFVSRRRVGSRLRVHEVLIGLAAGFLLYGSLSAIEEALYLNAAGAREILDAGPREWIWRHFTAAIFEHPWKGYGFGQGVLALREVAAHVQPSRNATYAHNFILDLMTWGGVPLGFALTAAVGAWVIRWLKRTPDAELFAQRHWVFAIWLALVFQSLLEFPFAHTFFLFPAALLAGVVTAFPAEEASGHQTVRYVASKPAMALGLLGTALLVGLANDYFRLEEDFRANRFERAKFFGTPAHQSYEHPLILDQFAALNATAHIRVRAGMPSDELQKLGVVARRFHLLPNRMDYARALALNGRMREAEEEQVALRAVYHPAQYAQIERDWRAWLQENEATIAESAR